MHRDTLMRLFVLLLSALSIEKVCMDDALSIVSNPVTLGEPMTVTCSADAVGGLSALGSEVTETSGMQSIYMSRMVDESEQFMVNFTVGEEPAIDPSIDASMVSTDASMAVMTTWVKLEKKAESSDIVKWKCLFNIILIAPMKPLRMFNVTFEQTAIVHIPWYTMLKWQVVIGVAVFVAVGVVVLLFCCMCADDRISDIVIRSRKPSRTSRRPISTGTWTTTTVTAMPMEEPRPPRMGSYQSYSDERFSSYDSWH